MDADHLYQRPTFMNQLLPTLLQEADAVTGCSQKTLQDVEEHIGSSLASKSRVIHNGANIHDFEQGETFQHSKPYILGIGRMVPQKGFDVLLRAYAQANLDSHDLILAGEGPETATLQALSAQLGLGERVHFIGRADRQKAISLFKGCSFFVLPSRADEGLPLVGVEAMAAGKAVVATPTGGVLEAMTDEENVLVVPKEDVAAMAAAIRRIAGNDDLREQLGRAGKLRARAFDWPVIAEEYVDLYRKVMNAPQSTLPVPPETTQRSV
jgi:glycosyltransferase involved in cell wall biosynthesis